MYYDDMEDIITLQALGDNYIYLFRYSRAKAAVIDPGQAKPVLNALKDSGLELTHILATHNHYDHIGGVKKLQKQTGCQKLVLRDGQTAELGEVSIKAIKTPGHTADSLCFYIEPAADKPGVLFTGDTLFKGGCGRPIGSDSGLLWGSLLKLCSFPEDTVVYPGHDYAVENYEFALSIEPDNSAVNEALAAVKAAQKRGEPAASSTVGFEKKTNIFLRAGEEAVKSALNMNGSSANEVFVELRKRKNMFG